MRRGNVHRKKGGPGLKSHALTFLTGAAAVIALEQTTLPSRFRTIYDDARSDLFALDETRSRKEPPKPKSPSPELARATLPPEPRGSRVIPDSVLTPPVPDALRDRPATIISASDSLPKEHRVFGTDGTRISEKSISPISTPVTRGKPNTPLEYLTRAVARARAQSQGEIDKAREDLLAARKLQESSALSPEAQAAAQLILNFYLSEARKAVSLAKDNPGLRHTYIKKAQILLRESSIFCGEGFASSDAVSEFEASIVVIDKEMQGLSSN